MTTSSEHDVHRFIGDGMNYAGIAFDLLLTGAAMTKWPDPSVYDKWWGTNGFCVSFDPTRRIETQVSASIVLIASAIAVYFFKESKKSTMNSVLLFRVETSIFSNFSHGFGHLFLNWLGGPPPPIDFSLTFEGLGWAITLLAFWLGVLKTLMFSASNMQVVILAIAIIGLQELLSVPPELGFTYSQSIILLSISVDQLMWPIERKGFTYMVLACSYMPLLALFVLESTTCSSFLAHKGGHAIYDSYLSIMP